MREALGPDASVLETREIREGLTGQKGFEIIASDLALVPSRFPEPSDPTPASGIPPAHQTQPHDPAAYPDPHDASGMKTYRRDRELAKPLSAEGIDLSDASIRPAHDEDLRRSLLKGLHASTQGWRSPIDQDSEHAAVSPEAYPTPTSNLPVTSTDSDFAGRPPATESREAWIAPSGESADGPDSSDLDWQATDTTEIDAVIARLVENQMDRATAERLVGEVLANPTHDDGASDVSGDDALDAEWVDLTSDRTRLHGRLIEQVKTQLNTSPPIRIRFERQQVVALVGPTGMGKTTTVAKLAANLKLMEHGRVGLITLDTFRVGAVGQLQTYADIMELPLIVASSADQMREALAQLEACDIVLIDTAGCSPLDESRMQELEHLLEVAQPDRTLLVVGASLGPAAMDQVVERFSSAGARSMILTKLDETLGAGAILRINRDSNLSLMYVCDGQQVPQDIRPADPTNLAERIVGRWPEVAHALEIPPQFNETIQDAPPADDHQDASDSAPYPSCEVSPEQERDGDDPVPETPCNGVQTS